MQCETDGSVAIGTEEPLVRGTGDWVEVKASRVINFCNTPAWNYMNVKQGWLQAVSQPDRSETT